MKRGFETFVVFLGVFLVILVLGAQNWESMVDATECSSQCSTNASNACQGQNQTHVCNCGQQISGIVWSGNVVYGTDSGTAKTKSIQVYCNRTTPCKNTANFTNAKCQYNIQCEPLVYGYNCSEYVMGVPFDKTMTSCENDACPEG